LKLDASSSCAASTTSPFSPPTADPYTSENECSNYDDGSYHNAGYCTVAENW
jgi:hypothetical protein